jgi:arsenate reductase
MVKKSPKKTKVLFVCIGNMCRSQMAEGFARTLGGDFVEPYSAGTHHTGLVSKETISVMREKGIDISEQYSKGLEDVPLEEMDVVVSMGCSPADELCPVTYLGAKIDWRVEDPIGQPMRAFRKTRDDIEEKVKDLLQTIRRDRAKART